MKVLLDTATFWWIASGSSRLSTLAIEIFVDPANEIALSPVSVWELLVKHQLGKLPTKQPFVDVLARARDERHIHSMPVRESAVLRLAGLPMLHRDPFDRMLICQALDEDMTLLTPDEQIRSYSVPTIW